MNTDKKAKKEGFFLSVFICVHPWLNLFVRSDGSIRFLGSSGMPVTSGVSTPQADGLIPNCRDDFGSQRTLPAELSRMTLESTAVSDVSGKCEQKPMPT